MLKRLFNPKSIAVVGASNTKGKVGYTILENIINAKKDWKIFPINIKEPVVQKLTAYKTVRDIPIKELDLAIIAIPKQSVPQVLKDCGKKKTKFTIIITAGFKETGDIESEKELIKIAKKYKIRIIGPNVLGILDNKSKLDCLFLPQERQKRPIEGQISVLSQSGTIGAIIIEQFEKKSVGLNKFISYGNASDINECDLLEYLEKDKDTKIICAYLEEIIDGKRFINILRKKKKPLIILKAGKSKIGLQSVQSHTGSLAGDFAVYKGLFDQFNIINANSINEMIDFAEVKQLKPIENITIITNGGGYGILLSDHLAKSNAPILQLKKTTKEKLRKNLPLGVSVENPIDILGDADINRYFKVIELTKNETQTYIIVLLGQVSSITKDMILILKEKLKEIQKIKNILIISTVEEYTKILDEDFIVYEFPEELAKAISCNIKTRFKN